LDVDIARGGFNGHCALAGVAVNSKDGIGVSDEQEAEYEKSTFAMATIVLQGSS